MPGQWSEIQLGGHSCDVYEPSRRNAHGYAVLYLHGVHLQRLRDHVPFTEQFERFGLPCVAPMTRRSWWTDRICPEFDPRLTVERHLLDNVVPWFDAQWQIQPPRVALLGTSMGGQGALRLAYKHPQRFPVVAALAPAIDYQIRFHDWNLKPKVARDQFDFKPPKDATKVDLAAFGDSGETGAAKESAQ